MLGRGGVRWGLAYSCWSMSWPPVGGGIALTVVVVLSYCKYTSYFYIPPPQGLFGSTQPTQAAGLFGTNTNTNTASGFGTGTGLFGQTNATPFGGVTGSVCMAS